MAPAQHPFTASNAASQSFLAGRNPTLCRRRGKEKRRWNATVNSADGAVGGRRERQSHISPKHTKPTMCPRSDAPAARAGNGFQPIARVERRARTDDQCGAASASRAVCSNAGLGLMFYPTNSQDVDDDVQLRLREAHRHECNRGC